MKSKTLNIIIADDHAVVRKGIREIIADEYTEAVFFEAGEGKGIFEILKNEHPDLIILDINMPGLSGIEVLKRLHDENIQVPVLVMSMQPEEHYAMRVLKAGASGFLDKGSDPSELIEAIRRILQGRKYIPASVAEQMAGQLGRKTGELPVSGQLSDREFEVMKLIASGKSVGQVAVLLNLSVNTISTYRARILEKLGLKNNAELIHFAMRNGIV